MSEVYVPLCKPDVILPAEKSFWGADLASCVIARGDAHVLMLISGVGTAEVKKLSTDLADALKEAAAWTEHMRGHMKDAGEGFDSAEWDLIEAYKWQNSELQDRAVSIMKGSL